MPVRCVLSHYIPGLMFLYGFPLCMSCFLYFLPTSPWIKRKLSWASGLSLTGAPACGDLLFRCHLQNLWSSAWFPKWSQGQGGTFKLRYVFKAIGNTLCKYVVTEYSCQIIAKRDKTDKGQESYKQKRWSDKYECERNCLYILCPSQCCNDFQYISHDNTCSFMEEPCYLFRCKAVIMH